MSVVFQPVQRDVEVHAEDEQTFLMKQQAQLSKQPTPATSTPVRAALSHGCYRIAQHWSDPPELKAERCLYFSLEHLDRARLPTRRPAEVKR